MSDLTPFTADMSWAYRGACVGHRHPEWWWPVDDANGTGYDLARKVCASCPVLKQCQKHGINHERHGMWGGLTAKQRREARSTGKIPPIGRQKYRADRGIAKKRKPGAQPKLTPEQVAEIQSSTEANTALGRRFGVSKETIRYVKQRLGAYARPPGNVKSTPDSTGATGPQGCSLGAQQSTPGDAQTPPELETPTEEVPQ